MSFFSKRRNEETESQESKLSRSKKSRFNFENGQSVFFNTKGLLPVVLQEVNTKTVVHLGYMNRQALYATMETREVHLFSRSKNAIIQFSDQNQSVFKVVKMQTDHTHRCLLCQIQSETDSKQSSEQPSAFSLTITG